jgi:transcription initiation factor TFIID subunit 7
VSSILSPVEVHKTHDHATYHKSADVGQMLIVYEDEYAMEEAENEKGYKIEGFLSYYHSGITPPMKRVVRRRFLSRFEERDVKPVPPYRSEVTEVEKEIQNLITKLSGEKGKGKGKGKRGGNTSATTTTKEKIIEEVEEEIVDYEPWMKEGATFTFEEAKLHPEWWLNMDEIREIEDSKKVELEEKLRKEEDARKAVEAAELEAAAAAERKKKKREKKKAKKKQEDDSLEALGDITNEIEAAASEEPMDEVTQAAMTISQGIDHEELLLEDDMFDFDNEDITDLFV